MRQGSALVRSQRHPPRFVSRAARAALVILGLVQLFVCAIVPLSEGGRPTSKLGAHIERQSERQHYVHDEAYCAACLASHLTGTVPLPAPVAPHATVLVVDAPATLLFPPGGERREPPPARAPPTASQLG